jgi:secreted Zn-dependent insulinase-like peptidase
MLEHIPEEVLQEAVHDVEMEYQCCKGMSKCRFEEVEKLLTKTNHPFNHFFTGMSISEILL